ncbi:SUN domain-containing protein 2-like isoform X2 [Pungitius pungitius]
MEKLSDAIPRRTLCTDEAPQAAPGLLQRIFRYLNPWGQPPPVTQEHLQESPLQEDATHPDTNTETAEAPQAAPGLLQRIFRYLNPWGQPPTEAQEHLQEAPQAAPGLLQRIFRYLNPWGQQNPNPNPGVRGEQNNPNKKKKRFKINLKTTGVKRDWRSKIMYFLLLLLFAGGVTQHVHHSNQLQDARLQITTLTQLMSRLSPVADTMANFAQESQGARVLHRLSSDTFRTSIQDKMMDQLLSWVTTSTDHQRIIQDQARSPPGACWCFAGAKGHAVVSLSHPIEVTHVTIGHVTKRQSLTGEINSAPREFSVYGLVHDNDEGIHLGSFAYNKNGLSSQTFELPVAVKDVFSHIKLEIKTNWGDDDQTCLYNFRVHGYPVSG